MFWNSVGQGLATLAHWEVLLGMFLLGAANVVLMHALMFAVVSFFSPTESARGFVSATRSYDIGGLIIQGVSITTFIVLLLPTLHGGDGFTPPEMAIGLIPRAFKYGFVSLLFFIILLCLSFSFAPEIGQLITGVPGVAMFLQGILILQPMSRLFIVATVGKERMSYDYFPGFLECVGYFIIGLILTLIPLIVILNATDRINKKRFPVQHMINRFSEERTLTRFQVIVGQFLCPAFGVIPLLMYCKHVAIGVEAFIAASAA